MESEPQVGLSLTVQHEHDTTTVTIVGELEYGTAGRLRTTLLDLAQGDTVALVIDMSGVEFLDSTGISLLVQAKRRFDANGNTLALRRPSARVDRVLEIAGVAQLFDIER